MIEVRKPGALTLIQDLGRTGHQRYGVPLCGAMDLWSHRVANALVGNPDHCATLEMVLTGPTLVVHADTLLALTGADVAAVVRGPAGVEPLPQGRPVWVRAGAEIECGVCQHGLRSYLAVHGGIASAPVLGSRSTWVRGRMGGLDGGPLARGDRLPVGPGRAGPEPDAAPVVVPVAAPASWSASPSGAIVVPDVPLRVPAPDIAAVQTIRVVEGGEWPVFTAASQATFTSAEYRISTQSDRMGYRLDGPALERAKPIEMISEAVVFGTVQVPPDGQPIVLMADRQTAGGYPKIACVASVDLPLLAQMGPRHALRFRMIPLADAQRILLARERELRHIRARLAQALRYPAR